MKHAVTRVEGLEALRVRRRFSRLRDGIGIVPGENSVARVPMKEF